MNKQNTKKNVYELTQERLRMIFNEFDNIYVSLVFCLFIQSHF